MARGDDLRERGLDPEPANLPMTHRAFFLRVFAVCVVAWTAVWLVIAAPAMREMLGGDGTFVFAVHVNDDVPVTAVTLVLMVAAYLLIPPALLAGIAVAVRAAIAKFANRYDPSERSSGNF